MTARFSLGIDLGTSNSAMALTELDADRPEIVPVLQVLAPAELGEKPTMASALYLPHPEEFRPDAFALPWGQGEALRIVGQFARDHGALVPDRLVTSAKSWLSNPHIDPRQRTLPWKSESAEDKLSPFECSRLYLEHLKGAFLHAARASGRDWDIGDGQIVVTVPASFDDVARNLTAEAAEAAGLGQVTLLEEPQAAFYAWAARAGRQWRDAVAPGDVILVCDVGGGTADFSLIAVTDVDGALELERISVGEHILLGGDNMDLALAYALRAGLEAEGKALDGWQFLALVHAAARAKIALFEDAALSEAPIAIPSRGASLFAKTISTALPRALLSQIVIDGFFAMTTLDDLPQEGRRAGLQEFGLPYASDPVISKHLARFLGRSLQNVRASDKLAALVGPRASGTALLPTAVLFNGGVFKAEPIRARVLELLASWNGGAPVRALEGFEPDLAVAQGAAVYGRRRATGQGMRIKAGAARSYYVGLETSMPAIPGFRPPVKALCVVPQGMQEGTEQLIEGRTFGLVTGETAEFRFFSSAVRSGDAPGEILPDAERELEETALLEVELPALADVPAGQVVPVRIEAIVTELGTLELWMKHANSDRKWKIEFQVRTQ
ncbi:molecular chaperone DnaK (HSP70) [Roseiarcus fermentans]|uniref:Molecular chaperone DnaK (HSP70) n=1 Tax=Roseiarcus fermentans TaxID=1473586 RepID=A0A366FQM9_9HYPH|nr:Hsp70 family protein [Roseiarcus fermentans]RBP16851.1 molecular chaperone DnaK (HSP70) [Roseiarcus fermentans]